MSTCFQFICHLAINTIELIFVLRLCVQVNSILLGALKTPACVAKMIFKIRHGILVCTSYSTNKKSAIIFNDEFIITSAYLLYPHLQKCKTSTPNTDQEAIAGKLKSHKVVDSSNDFLKALQFEITYDRHKMQARAKILHRYKAQLLYIFNCADILATTDNILKGLQQYAVEDDASSNTELLKLMTSSFIILQLVYPDNRSSNFAQFIDQMKNYIKFISPINKLDDVLTISTPFGMESFYKTMNIGKVSNVFGINSCMFTVSSNLVVGCEGAAVINSKLRLIGIITCTSFRCNNENANLTLAANFCHILKEFLRSIGETYTGAISRYSSTPHWENAVVLLSNAGSWGTGSLVKIRKTKFILTCSHVIKNPKEKISCHYVNGSFETNLLWKNPNFNEPYDIAIIEIPISMPDHYFLRVSNEMPHVGQTIYCAGFPLISQLGKEMFRPSLYEGRIVKFSPGMIVSDASIQAGQSGGPILDVTGSLVGVSVSNSKDHETQIIYPNINMSVPVANIKPELENFAKTKDVKCLNNLIAGTEIQDTWALKGPLVECKL